MKTPEQVKEYRHGQYERHKDYHYQKYREWCRDNPKAAATIQKRWRDNNPHYYRDYMRKRKAVTKPLISLFLDDGFDGGGDVDGFISYLRSIGIPEQRLQWFKTDVQKYLQGA